MDDPEVLASDADRERVADLLRQHCTDGRLTLDEFEERLGEVYAARTLADLKGPLRQLPDLTPPPPPPPRERRPMDPRLRRWLTISAVLVGIWALSGAGYFWPLWPMFWIGFVLIKKSPGCVLSRSSRAMRGRIQEEQDGEPSYLPR